MDAPATIVWLSPEPPDAQESRALSSWSYAHGVRLAPPSRERARALEVDPQIGDGVETWLDRARDAIAARDGDEADRALSAAESILRAHAELPQAAWLMAELLRARAARWRQVPPLDVEAAEDAWARAEALDGGRVPGVGEEAGRKHAPAATMTVDLSDDDATPWLDGKPLDKPLEGPPDATTSTRAGVHALVVTSAGATVWAGWVDASDGASTVRVDVQGPPPCSTEDVARARTEGAAAVDARHVRCSAWVAANSGSRAGSVRVALCETGRCGAMFEWREPAPWTWSPPASNADDRRKWPAWATWALLGGGAAVAASVAVIASGALSAPPAETRFVSGGIRSQ